MNRPSKSKDSTTQPTSCFSQCLGEELYLLRKDQKKSIKVVAKDTKMSPRTITKVEKGLLKNFYPSILYKLCKYYNANIRDVLGRAEIKDMANTT
ncbi:helix-turn-helix transcriptional regulator [Chitinophaga sp.]|uniref:helix-turn-helix domain-containing protein n=1 Tax=Chitinophaga sp. TaxID=1869181 RepID=UPI0031DBEE6B